MSNLDKTAIPINDQKHNDDLENNNQNVNVESYPIPQNRVILLGIDNSDHIKSVIYSRAKVVKFLTIIDGFFLTLNFIISIVNRNLFWLFFFLLPLCFAGYKGAKEYKKNYLLGYIFYLFLMSIVYLFLTFYYSSFIVLIVFIVELYLFSYCSRLYYYLSHANDQIIESLRANWNPENTTYYYI